MAKRISNKLNKKGNKAGMHHATDNPLIARIVLQLTPKDKEKIKQQAEKQGLSISDYIRKRLSL